VFWGLIRTPAEKRDAKAIEEARVKSNQIATDVLERSLAGRAYVTGRDFTMGDIPIGCEVQRWMRCPIERPKLPNVEAWFGRLGQRAPFKKIVDIPLS